MTAEFSYVEACLHDLAGRIDPRDCRRMKRWLRTAKLERYKNVDSALVAAKRSIKPRPENWHAIQEFLWRLLPILLTVIIK